MLRPSLRVWPVRWWRVIPVKFIGGMGTLGAGMVLGREGPMVQLGGNLGRMVVDVFRMRSPEARHTLLATGAAAGLSAAFALSTGFALPEPSSVAWWIGRPLWLAVAFGATALLATFLAGIETATAPPSSAQGVQVGSFAAVSELLSGFRTGADTVVVISSLPRIPCGG